ncbi:MAG: cobalamin-dependent protein [Candidatus Nezhaarchaeales archaeon]
MSKRLKVLIAKPGLNGHDRGAKVVATALREAGMEVIYTGRHQTPERIASIAVDEDVDVVGLSILSGAHLTLSQEVIKLLKEKGKNVPVVVGGVIPDKDIVALKSMGVAEVFPVGSKLSAIVDYFKRLQNLKEAGRTP